MSYLKVAKVFHQIFFYFMSSHEELIMDEGIYYEMWHDQLQSGEIEQEEGCTCSCCPNGIHQEQTDGEETEEEIEALVERELAEAEVVNTENITEAKITGTEDNSDEEIPNRNSRVLFALDGSNKDLKIIEEGEDGYVDDCKCPCHLQQEVIDDLMSDNPTLEMFSRQISAQGTSLEDVAEPIGEVTGPDVLAPLDDTGQGEIAVKHDKGIQVKMVSKDMEEEDLDDLFNIPQRPHRYAKARHIGRTISMSERPRPRLYDRPLSVYDRHRLASSSDGRDRVRTASTGEELGGSVGAAGSRGLRRQLTRQQSCLHARCKAKEFRERQISRDRDRDNANRLSVKDHEHFSVSIDDLNAATEQYYRDSEDNSALKTTIVTPTDEKDEEKKYPTVADVIKENNRHSLRNSMEVKVDIDPEV